MMREEIKRLEGRELDAAVAEHVMGWERYGPPGFEYLGNPRTDPETDPDWSRVPRYSTDIAAAWQVVELMRERGWTMRLYEWQKGGSTACFFRHNGRLEEHWASGRNPAEAISRAALLAVCGEENRNADA